MIYSEFTTILAMPHFFIAMGEALVRFVAPRIYASICSTRISAGLQPRRTAGGSSLAERRRSRATLLAFPS